MERDVDDQVDPALVWWLLDLAQHNRELYRRVRAIAWSLVQANPDRSANPNERS